MGNGRAIAVRAGAEGAAVAVTDVHGEAAEFTAELVRSTGAPAHALAADAADPASAETSMSWALEVLGGIDALVCNVGIGRGFGLEATSVEDWDAVMAVNLRAHFLMLKAALPHMTEGFSAVLVSSVAGLRPGSWVPAYDASKAAQIALMRQAAKEAAGRKGRVNALAPGLIDTPLGRLASSGRPGRERTPVPLGRQGTAQEVAAAAVFLLSDQAGYITGQVLAVDGGLSTLL